MKPILSFVAAAGLLANGAAQAQGNPAPGGDTAARSTALSAPTGGGFYNVRIGPARSVTAGAPAAPADAGCLQDFQRELTRALGGRSLGAAFIGCKGCEALGQQPPPAELTFWFSRQHPSHLGAFGDAWHAVQSRTVAGAAACGMSFESDDGALVACSDPSIPQPCYPNLACTTGYNPTRCSRNPPGGACLSCL